MSRRASEEGSIACFGVWALGSIGRPSGFGARVEDALRLCRGLKSSRTRFRFIKLLLPCRGLVKGRKAPVY